MHGQLDIMSNINLLPSLPVNMRSSLGRWRGSFWLAGWLVGWLTATRFLGKAAGNSHDYFTSTQLTRVSQWCRPPSTRTYTTVHGHVDELLAQAAPAFLLTCLLRARQHQCCQ